MQVISVTQSEKKVDTNLLVFTQLSQLLTYVTGFGGFIVPLILWLVKKDEIAGMDVHGKYIVNFQITMILIAILSIPGILLFGLGILSLIWVGIVSFVMPIVNAVKASKGENPSYFSTIRFIS
ncbi:MAG: tRNA modification GTPase [Flavobacteriaceae bacterium]|nr:tRNA modification GTPase [Flavobacteriaceae bacterium]